MTQDLIDRFNQIEASLALVAQRLPRIANSAKVQELQKHVERLARLMKRKKYRIGFIGGSQFGKSATICSLLGVEEGQGPTPSGGGGATTSCVTRLFRVEPDEPPSLVMEYMTEEEFQLRKRSICELLRLDADKGDGELIASIEQQLTENPPKKVVLEFLLRLLRAHTAHRNVLGQTRDGNYQDRARYVCHETDVTPYALLRQVLIGFPTDDISPELEIIDLPGLGVANKADALLTRDFVPQLDGAFIFQTAKQLSAEAAADLLDDLREQFSNLENRVWCVVTRFDDLDPNGIDGGQKGVTAFDHLRAFLKAHSLRSGQVLLIGNGFYQGILRGGGTLDALSAQARHDLYIKCNFVRDTDSGEPIVPEKFRSHASELVAAYEAVIKNQGGIPRLRNVVGKQVYESVVTEVRRDVESQLRAIASELRGILNAARLKASMSVDAIINAARWVGALDQLIEDLRADKDGTVYEKPGEELKNHLVDLMRQIATGGDYQLVAPDHHQLWGRVLAQQAKAEGLETVSTIYQCITARMGSINVPPVKYAGTTGPAEREPRQQEWPAFDAQRQSYFEDDYCLPFKSFFEGYPRPEPGEDVAQYSVPMRDYRQIINKKIGVVVHSFVARVARGIERCLAEARAEYSRLGLEEALSDASARDCETILQAIPSE